MRAITFPLTPMGESATLYKLDGTQTIVPADDGYYYFDLKPASDFSYPDVDAKRITAIGGEPIILIESTDGRTAPIGDYIVADAGIDNIELRPTIAPTAGALVIPAVRATVAPENDTSPPIPTMQALPPSSNRIFTVIWGAQDNGEVKNYFVWVRVNEETGYRG